MTSTLLRRLWRLVPMLAVIVLLLGEATPASAMGCFMTLKRCYIAAAGADSYFDAVLASADCELDFAFCFRNEVFGF